MQDSYQSIDQNEEAEKPKMKMLCFVIPMVLFAGILTVVIVVAVLSKDWRKEQAGSVISFLYVNDIHVDPRYNPYASLNYCTEESNATKVKKVFGQYGCDTPKETYDSFIEYAKTITPKPKFILYGGDTIAHGLTKSISDVQERFRVYFNQLNTIYRDVPILITIGNNDYYPNYGKPDTDVQNFESLADVLVEGNHLTPEQEKTFRKGGYYYQDFEKYNLRIAILNTVIYSEQKRPETTGDLYGQLEWLENITIDAENKGLKVGIAAHIPPGVSYIGDVSKPFDQGWSDEYMIKMSALDLKYKFQFFLGAHTHLDLMMPVYGEAEKVPYFLSSPSISPQHGNNPAFRIYKVKNGQIVDYDQYYTRLLRNPEKLEWQLEYTFSKTYYASDISPNSLRDVVKMLQAEGSDLEAWKYKAFSHSIAFDNGKYYFCVLNCSTRKEIDACASQLAEPHLLHKYRLRQ